MDGEAWLTLDGSLAENREQEFYWLWIFATLGYGVGDIVTTLALVGHSPFVKEGNVLVKWLFAVWGIPGFVTGKLVVFSISFAVSLYALNAWDDRLLYYFPPLVLTIFGGFITGYNIFLMSI